MRRAVNCGALCLCLGLLAAGCRAAEPPTASLELQVKAAFVYNFAKFVEWPAASATGDRPLTFCVAGAEPLYDVLKQSLSGKTVGGRHTVVRRIENRLGNEHCNVIFLGGDRERLAETLASAGWNGALTVGDSDHFAERGGMIQLIKEEDKFRFAINVDAVNRSGLRISAKLLQLSTKLPASPPARSRP